MGTVLQERGVSREIDRDSRIDVVIPARNEAETITRVLRPLALSPYIGSITVVVDDMTSDDTSGTATKYLDSAGKPWIVDRQTGLYGKGQCVSWGLRHTGSEAVMFTDADLRGMTIDHIESMVTAADPANARMVIGVPDYPPGVVPKHVIFSWPWVSGTRIVPRWMACRIKLHGYLMENQLNTTARRYTVPTVHITMGGVKAPFQWPLSPLRQAQSVRDANWAKENGWG